LISQAFGDVGVPAQAGARGKRCGGWARARSCQVSTYGTANGSRRGRLFCIAISWASAAAITRKSDRSVSLSHAWASCESQGRAGFAGAL